MRIQSQRFNIWSKCVLPLRGARREMMGNWRLGFARQMGESVEQWAWMSMVASALWSSFAVLAFFFCVCVSVCVCVCVRFDIKIGGRSPPVQNGWTRKSNELSKLWVKFGAQLSKITELAPLCGWFFGFMNTEKWNQKMFPISCLIEVGKRSFEDSG